MTDSYAQKLNTLTDPYFNGEAFALIQKLDSNGGEQAKALSVKLVEIRESGLDKSEPAEYNPSLERRIYGENSLVGAPSSDFSNVVKILDPKKTFEDPGTRPQLRAAMIEAAKFLKREEPANMGPAYINDMRWETGL